jgi:hypothetical protein
MIGKVNDVPEITTHYSISPSTIRSDTAMIEPVQSPPTIESTHDVYLWEFSAIVPQLKKWWADGTISPEANFYTVIGNNKYGGFTFEEFISLDLTDLELLGNFEVLALFHPCLELDLQKSLFILMSYII